MDIRFRQDVEAIKDYVATMADAFTRIADSLERLAPKKKMTNLDWIRTLNANELADWFYDEWIDHMQYAFSSSRGGLKHWLKEERVDTPQTKRIKTPDYCDICNHNGCDNCIANSLDDYCVPSGYAPKDTPQTDLSTEEFVEGMKNLKMEVKQTDCDKCIWNVCNYNKVDWEADTPQTEVYDYKGNGKWERNE